MHSGGMRAARALAIRDRGVQGGVPAWGGVPARGCVYLPGGCTCPGGVPALVVYLLGDVPTWGVYLPGGCTCPDTPPSPMNRMTDRCKNITLPQISFAGGNKEFLNPSGMLENLTIHQSQVVANVLILKF